MVSSSTGCKRTAMAATNDPGITVFAWGNESRGDDAIGSVLARRITELGNPAIELVEDHQLNLEHVMDIHEGVPVLFLDASVAINSDYHLERLAPQRDDSISTHSISPQALLDLYRQTLGKEAPDAFLLHVRGEYFELGESISDAARARVAEAWRFLSDILSGPREKWAARLSVASAVE